MAYVHQLILQLFPSQFHSAPYWLLASEEVPADPNFTYNQSQSLKLCQLVCILKVDCPIVCRPQDMPLSNTISMANPIQGWHK